MVLHFERYSDGIERHIPVIENMSIKGKLKELPSTNWLQNLFRLSHYTIFGKSVKSNVERLDLVWDVCIANSLKNNTSYQEIGHHFFVALKIRRNCPHFCRR